MEFCGYSIPHPAEPKMNLRIQTYGMSFTFFALLGLGVDFVLEGTTVWDALAKGLDDLLDLCGVVEERFIGAREEFMERMVE